MESLINKIITAIADGSGIPRNTAATIMLTLFTFCLGYILTWGASYIVKLKKRWLYKKSLKIIIADFLKSCEKQYLEFEKFPTQVGYLNGDNYTVSIASSYSHNFLAKTDITVFIENFSSIWHKGRAKEISQLFEYVEKVVVVKQTLKEVVAFTHKMYSENFHVYNENLDNVRKLCDNMVYELTQRDPNIVAPSDYEISILNVFKKWKENGSITHINTTLNELVNPMYEQAIKTSPSLISKNVIDYTLKCRLAVINIKSYEKYLKESVAESLEVHKKVFTGGSEFVKKW